MKAVFRILLFLLLLGAAALAGYFFLDFDKQNRKLLSLIPTDFVYLIESDQPVKDWQSLSESDVWQYLKGNAFFGDITESADYLDSLLRDNQRIIEMVELGDMYISAHMISAQTYDFLIITDLKEKGSKLTKLKPALISLFKSFGYSVSTTSYYNTDIYGLYDPATKETIYLSALNNALLVSYTEALVKKSIEQSEKPSIEENKDFVRVRTETRRSEQYTLYLNFALTDAFLKAYTSEMPEMLSGLGSALAFSAMDLSMRDDRIFMDGYLKQLDSAASYFAIFGETGKGRVQVQDILPKRTALFTSVGFDNFTDFYGKLNEMNTVRDPEAAKSMDKDLKRLEKLFKIEFERDFFSWMTEEVATAVIPTDSGPDPYYYYAMLHFDDFEKVQDRLGYVTKRLGKSPLKFEELDYQGYKIKYLTMRGFFQIFFKKMFSKIEKPHFTYIDNYVVFSNDTTALQLMIDAYLQEDVLGRDPEYQSFQREFAGESNVFAYIRTANFYDYLNGTLDYEARRGLQKNQEYLRSFPHIGFQITPSGDMFKTHVEAAFRKPEPALSSQ